MSVSVTGRLDHLNAAIKKLQDNTMQRICRQVAEVGVTVAREAYQSAGLLPGDSPPIVSTTQWDGNGLYVQFQGEDVLFIEFGTGLYQSGTDYGASHGFTPGSYSEVNAEWLVPPKVKWFQGQWPIPGAYGPNKWTYGQQPAGAVGAATDAMHRAVAEEFTRIWNGG